VDAAILSKTAGRDVALGAGQGRPRRGGADNPTMSPRALIDLTAALLSELLRFEHPADKALSAFFRRQRSLGPRERHAVAETVYTVLRRRSVLQHLAQGGAGPLARRLVLLGWQAEASQLERGIGPEESRWLAHVRTLPLDALAPHLRRNLPQWVDDALGQSMLPADRDELAASLLVAAPLDLRVNTLRGSREQARAALAVEGVLAQPTPWSPWGLRVQGKPAIHKMAVFLDGRVEVQDEGSQLLALLTGASRGQMVVDFCAGAGGKTLALGAMMRNTGRLYAFDTSAHRLGEMQPRLARSGLSNVHPAALAHERDDRVRRLAGKIDSVLVDAPCTGLGTLRRNPDLKWRQTPAAVSELVPRQLAILASAARLLRPGGRLVYATCSLLRAENEDVVAAFEAAHCRDFEPLSAGALLSQARVEGAADLDTEGRLRLWPHRHGTDGFFAAVWTRR
jgi:16S rRNA (cytosine967-C5)-methyltransferase